MDSFGLHCMALPLLEWRKVNKLKKIPHILDMLTEITLGKDSTPSATDPEKAQECCACEALLARWRPIKLSDGPSTLPARFRDQLGKNNQGSSFKQAIWFGPESVGTRDL